MNAVVMALLGAAVGGGVVLFVLAAVPVTRPVHEVFAAVERPGVRFGEQRSVERGFTAGFGRAAMGLLGRGAVGNEQLTRDLAITGSSLESHAVRKVAGPALAVLGTYAAWVIGSALGAQLHPLWATVLAVGLAGVLYITPDARLRSRARRARTGFRHALSAYLDLVTVIMSGGGGLLTALQSAADAGDGWAFAEIRGALDRARLSNQTPWSQLGVLGERFDISELRDLVAAADLAGSEGARISESVATKADVLRARLQAEVEHDAEALTEQMLLPVGLLLVALFLFLGYAVFDQLGQSEAPRFAELGFIHQSLIGSVR